MMNDQILLPDRREAIAGMIADALGKARIVRHEFEVGAIDLGQKLRHLVEREHAVHQEDLVVGDGERALDEAAQLLRHRGFHFEADRRAAAAALEHALELHHEVFGFFLDLDIAVAHDAEGALPLHRVTREQLRDEQPDDMLERDQPRAAVGGRQADDPLDLLRDADERVHRLAVARAGKLQGNGEPEIGNERERMRRVDRKRRQHREDVREEIILKPGAIRLFECRAFDQHNGFLREILAQFLPALLLIAGELGDFPRDRGQLLGRRQAVRAADGDVGAHLPLEAGDADHEELVEVVGRDRQEADPFQQRMGRVLGLFEHPPVELKPGQFAVDEPVGRQRSRNRRNRLLGRFLDLLPVDFYRQYNGLGGLGHVACPVRPEYPNAS
jgi:hypothetical protein